MRSPSLYSHFESKNAIYDAMFEQAWREWCTAFDAQAPRSKTARRALLAGAEAFFDFAVADLARYQLMNQRTIPDFRPSTEAYAVSVAAYERMRGELRERGVRTRPTWICGPHSWVGSSISSWPTTRAVCAGDVNCRGWWTCTATRSACPARA